VIIRSSGRRTRAGRIVETRANYQQRKKRRGEKKFGRAIDKSDERRFKILNRLTTAKHLARGGDSWRSKAAALKQTGCACSRGNGGWYTEDRGWLA
jgi:hypothetical protein